MQQTAGAAEPIGLAIERLIDAPVDSSLSNF